MDKRKREILEELPREWVRQRAADRNVSAVADEAADLLLEWVGRYNYGPEEIKALLQIMFRHVVWLACTVGAEEGRGLEKATNPALKGFGEALADALKTDRQARRKIADTIFQAEVVRGSNLHFAFNQVLKALGE